MESFANLLPANFVLIFVTNSFAIVRKRTSSADGLVVQRITDVSLGFVFPMAAPRPATHVKFATKASA